MQFHAASSTRPFLCSNFFSLRHEVLLLTCHSSVCVLTEKGQRIPIFQHFFTRVFLSSSEDISGKQRRSRRGFVTEQVFFNKSAILVVKVSDTFSETKCVCACVCGRYYSKKVFISLPKCLPRQETIEKQLCDFPLFKGETTRKQVIKITEISARRKTCRKKGVF